MAGALADRESPSPERIKLSEYFSMVPPPGWEASIAFDNLPLRLVAYGKLLFQPPGVKDVFLKWQIANWLEGEDEWDYFLDLLAHRGQPSGEELKRLYSLLLRIPIEHISEYSITIHAGLGPGLVLDYQFARMDSKGRVLYVPSPTGPSDIQIVSYEGREPNFSAHLIEALIAMDSSKQVRPFRLPLAFILPRPNLSLM